MVWVAIVILAIAMFIFIAEIHADNKKMATIFDEALQKQAQEIANLKNKISEIEEK